MNLEDVERTLRAERLRFDDKLETLQAVIDQIRTRTGDARQKAKIVVDLLNHEPMMEERRYIRKCLK